MVEGLGILEVVDAVTLYMNVMKANTAVIKLPERQY